GLASPRKGVIYTIAPSPLDAAMIWIGTDDGWIQRSDDDGQHWNNVTPPQLTAWSKVGISEASHFDKQTAYAAVDRHRLDDLKPYIYRTHDGGKTWNMIANGIPQGSFANVVREDPKRRGLLYAGTDLGIYVSFNDGANWQPLQLNLPIASVRDIAVHENDLVVATHGRSFWVLDDIAPLRQVNPNVASQSAFLFPPSAALRIRPASDQGTPLPRELPHGENPPKGAAIDYYIKNAASAPVVLEILNTKGEVVRRYASNDNIPAAEEKSLRVTMDWAQQQQPLSAAAGMHRFFWDLRYPPPTTTPSWRSDGGGVWAMPGTYTVRLTAEGRTYERQLAVDMDPRVHTSTADLQLQFEIAQQGAAAVRRISRAMKEARSIDDQVLSVQLRTTDPDLRMELAQFAQRLSIIKGPPPPDYGAAVTPLNSDETSLEHLLEAYTELEDAVESADRAPTYEQQTAAQTYNKTLQSTM